MAESDKNLIFRFSKTSQYRWSSPPPIRQPSYYFYQLTGKGKTVRSVPPTTPHLLFFNRGVVQLRGLDKLEHTGAKLLTSIPGCLHWEAFRGRV